MKKSLWWLNLLNSPFLFFKCQFLLIQMPVFFKSYSCFLSDNPHVCFAKSVEPQFFVGKYALCWFIKSIKTRSRFAYIFIASCPPPLFGPTSRYLVGQYPHVYWLSQQNAWCFTDEISILGWWFSPKIVANITTMPSLGWLISFSLVNIPGTEHVFFKFLFSW